MVEFRFSNEPEIDITIEKAVRWFLVVTIAAGELLLFANLKTKLDRLSSSNELKVAIENFDIANARALEDDDLKSRIRYFDLDLDQLFREGDLPSEFLLRLDRIFEQLQSIYSQIEIIQSNGNETQRASLQASLSLLQNDLESLKSELDQLEYELEDLKYYDLASIVIVGMLGIVSFFISQLKRTEK